MNEIEKSNSNSDVSSNSSWTFLEDGEKNNNSTESKKSGNSAGELVSEDVCEVKSAKPTSCENGNRSSDHQNNDEVNVKKQNEDNIKQFPFNLYNTLQNKSFIGTLTIVGTVLALTGLSFLCLLFPSSNPSPIITSNPLENVTNVCNNPSNYAFPIYETENGNLVVEDPKGILKSKLKEGPPTATTEKQPENVEQYPDTYADYMRLRDAFENESEGELTVNKDGPKENQTNVNKGNKAKQ